MFKSRAGQGATEYILLLVVVVALVLMFKGKIKDMMTGKLDELGKGMGGITTEM